MRSASCLRSRASLIGCMFWAGAGMGQQAGIRPNATSVLRNHCSVWDGEIQERAIEVEGESDSVYAIDVWFATGSPGPQVRRAIWSATTHGETLWPAQTWFSPNIVIRWRDRGGSVCVLDNHNGDRLIDSSTCMTITRVPRMANTSLAWSNGGEQFYHIGQYWTRTK